jgi:hypothetical protein
MAYDSSGLLNNENGPVPDGFIISSIILIVLLIADLGFTGFRNDSLGLIVTAFLFLVTPLSYVALTERTLLSDGNVLDGFLGALIGILFFNVFDIVNALDLSFLSTATSSYLSAILGAGQQDFVIPVINIIFAPVGETLLIFGITAGIWRVLEQTKYSDADWWKILILLGTGPSLVFGVLHGARNLSFLLFAFSFNMVWTALLVLSDRNILSSKWIPFNIGLVAGLHIGHNSANFGGITKFLQILVESLGGRFSRSSSLILLFFSAILVFGLVRLYLVAREKDYL